jgi:glycosyltransferase involved in cell wall biosynthesis
MGETLVEMGFSVRALGLNRARPNPLRVLRLARWMRAARPDVVQTWMYHADLLGGLAALLAGRPPVVWGVRQSNVDERSIPLRTVRVARMCARLSSRLPRRILVNAAAARERHVAIGYDADRFELIPNGFDTALFRPDPEARRAVRAEHGIAPEAPLVGLVANFTPQKDHANFARAAGLLAARRADVRFLLCGRGITEDNTVLVELLAAAGVRDRCLLLGPRDDVHRLDAALDVATSASFGEGFANAIGEAMACGVPCAVTAAGDSAEIVGDGGRSVPPDDAPALAGAWEELLNLSAADRDRLGRAARARIEAHYALPAIAARYAALYEEIAGA